jgi:cytosine/adenosine deaminase-related metal-dependent hydrolase
MTGGRRPRRTKIEGGYVVAFDGLGHRLLERGVVVFEGDRILHVGRSFDGPVEATIRAPGRRLVAPGFINTHTHAGSGAGFKLISDTGRRDLFGAGYLNYAVPLEGKQVAAEEPGPGARQYVVELLRGGTTTAVESGAPPAVAEEVVRAAGELGLRVYVGPGFAAGSYYYDRDGVLHWDLDEQRGLAALEAARAFVRRHDGSYDGRIRGSLTALQVDTGTSTLFRAARRAADELGAICQVHAAQHLVETRRVVATTGRSPIELLAESDFLAPGTFLAHCIFTSAHPWAADPAGRDLEIVAASGAAIAHSPHLYARRGMPMLSFERLRRAGIPVTIGTDNRPFDLVAELRLTSYFAKMLEGSVAAAPAGDVFTAATLGAASALGRDDVGRLSPGAKADIVVFNLDKPRFGVIHDPIRSLIECGISDDVETVVVDGRIVVENGRLPGVDEAELIARLQAEAEQSWARFSEWDYAGRSADEVFPPSFPRWEAP